MDQTFCDTESKVHLLSEKVSVFQAADEPGRLLRNNSFPSRPCHRRTPGIKWFQKGDHIIEALMRVKVSTRAVHCRDDLHQSNYQLNL